MLFVLCCVAVITVFLVGRLAMQQAPGGIYIKPFSKDDLKKIHVSVQN